MCYVLPNLQCNGRTIEELEKNILRKINFNISFHFRWVTALQLLNKWNYKKFNSQLKFQQQKINYFFIIIIIKDITFIKAISKARIKNLLVKITKTDYLNITIALKNQQKRKNNLLAYYI